MRSERSKHFLTDLHLEIGMIFPKRIGYNPLELTPMLVKRDSLSKQPEYCSESSPPSDIYRRGQSHKTQHVYHSV